MKKEKSSVITPINTQIAQSGGQKLKGTVEIQHPLKILGLSYNFPHPRSLFAAQMTQKLKNFGISCLHWDIFKNSGKIQFRRKMKNSFGALLFVVILTQKKYQKKFWSQEKFLKFFITSQGRKNYALNLHSIKDFSPLSLALRYCNFCLSLSPAVTQKVSSPI